MIQINISLLPENLENSTLLRFKEDILKQKSTLLPVIFGNGIKKNLQFIIQFSQTDIITNIGFWMLSILK